MRVVVIGGGLQGVGIALELALRGVSVDLFEQREGCLTQASFHNEGKIHLGFLYAKDPTPYATARLLAHGAYRFESIVTRWLEMDLRLLLSSPFYYLAHRDSLLSPTELSAHYAAVSDILKQAASEAGTSYFGLDGAKPVRRLSPRESDEMVDSTLISAVFETPEVAIDPQPLARLLRARIAGEKRIRVRISTQIEAVTHSSEDATVWFRGSDGAGSESYDHVVNASWESRLALDATAKVPLPDAWSFRTKYFMRFPVAQAVNTPSVTIVLGAFGDTVRYSQGDIFLTWYPVGRQCFSSDLRPPAWPVSLVTDKAAAVRRGTYEALRRILPCLDRLSPDAVASCAINGGVIYALGNTDVHNPASRLHERHNVGPRSYGRYHSVDTGRYSLAPLFAKLTADRIVGVA